MRVILLKNIEKIGDKYEIVDVASGYAQNFLFPRELAKPATPVHLRQLEAKKKEWQKKRSKEIRELRKEVDRIKGEKFTIKKKVNEEGRLFGSVDAGQIKEALEKRGFDVKKAEVVLKEPIKETGEWAITISFPHRVEAEIKLVVEENES